nr:hypothetical protein [Bacteroidetes bacterium endosymbiont of Geopemphigus sp.]
MIKPVFPYLDIVRSVMDHFDVPVASLSRKWRVCDEIKAANRQVWIEGKEAMLESPLL